MTSGTDDAYDSAGSRLPAALRDGLARSRLPGLDGLRMISVFSVVFYHCGLAWSPGSQGVLAFFVLSGFLITWLLLKEEDQFGNISLTLFYFRRALRIFPAFYCFWALWTGYALIFDKRIIWPQAVSSLLYVSNYYQAIFGDPNTAYSHTWSLGIEEQFYLLWPVCFIALRLHARRIAGLAILIGTVWFYRVVLQFGFGVDQSYIFEAFDTRADHLAVGCLLALLLRGGMWAGLWSWLSRPWMSLATVALLIFSNMLGYSFGYPYRDTVGFAIDPILIAVLIIQVIALRDSALWSWLNWAPVRYLGAMSYSIYLYQQVVIGRAQQTFAWMPAAIQLTATVSIVLLVAAVSYHLIERPFLRSKKLAAQSLGVRRITPGPMGSGESLIGA